MATINMVTKIINSKKPRTSDATSLPKNDAIGNDIGKKCGGRCSFGGEKLASRATNIHDASHETARNERKSRFLIVTKEPGASSSWKLIYPPFRR